MNVLCGAWFMTNFSFCSHVSATKTKKDEIQLSNCRINFFVCKKRRRKKKNKKKQWDDNETKIHDKKNIDLYKFLLLSIVFKTKAIDATKC